MKLANTEELRLLDRQAMEEGGMPGILLMEQAGKAVADVAVAYRENVQKQRGDYANAVVVCGKGNNGGDGLVAARWLYNWGWRVRVLLIGAQPQEIQGDAALALQLLGRAGVEVLPVQDETELGLAEVACVKADLIIDALLGTGFKGELQGLLQQTCTMLNRVPTEVLAVDVPSGVNGDTGAADEAAVEAVATVTMALPKIGFFLQPAEKYVGQLFVADIGLPSKLVRELPTGKYRLTETIVSRLLPVREVDAHKGDAGRVVILAGSPGYLGAAALAVRGALRAGAGLVSLLTPLSSRDPLAIKLTEAMVHGLMERMPGILGGGAVKEILHFTEQADVVALGPGLGTSESTRQVIRELLPQLQKPVVLDADGLTALQGHTELLQEMQAPKVLTPHVGEMAALTGLTVEEIKAAKVAVAQKYAVQWQSLLVLKGAPTVIACPDGKVYLSTTGCNAMATGGSGDVLTGIIAGLAGQEITLQEAVLCGVYLHGLAGERAHQGQIGLVAGELAEALPQLRAELAEVPLEEVVLNSGIKAV